MNILIDISHPAHVHLFKNVYKALINNHNVIVTARKMPIIEHLLTNYKIPYIIIGKKRNSIIGKLISILMEDLKALLIVKKNKIDIGLSSGIVLSHVSLFSKMKTIVFDDDDDIVEPLFVKYGHPLTSTILSPCGINRNTKKLISYSGTHELAYLHPHNFTPDPKVLIEYGISKDEKFFVLRFVAFKGHHDIGQGGIIYKQKKELIEMLNKYGKVFITSENVIEEEFEQYRIPIPAEKIHSFMYYSRLFLGDSQTMTTEAALLGVPSFKCNTFAGKLTIPNNLEKKYNLCYSYHPSEFDKFITHIETILKNNESKTIWKERQEIFLKEMIDVSSFFVWFIENYPQSVQVMKENPDYQYNFR